MLTYVHPLAIGFLVLFFSMPVIADSPVAALIDEARKFVAPDKRTVVFDVHGELAGSTLTLTGEIQSEAHKKQLLEFLKSKGSFRIVDSLIVLPHPSVSEKPYGVVSVSVANIRTKPGHSQEMATQVLLGTPLKILKKQDGWFLVQTPEQYLGWTDDMIERFDSSGYAGWAKGKKVIITKTYTHSYSQPDANSQVVSDLVAGNILLVNDAREKFYGVTYPDGRNAFVQMSEASHVREWLGSAKDTPETIIATARRFMGVPYLWGGTSAKGMDCSGFTKIVFYLNGVLLPRDANQQAAVGEPVSLDDDFKHLKMGDLVFFGRKASADRPERITHVGIYIKDKQFIHESGDVRINSFNPADANYSEYRTSTLVRATRVIGVGADKGVQRFLGTPYLVGHEH